MYKFIPSSNENTSCCSYATVNQYRKHKFACNESFRIFFIDWSSIENANIEAYN